MRRVSLLIAACACAVCCASCGPRMASQPSIRPYETRMPPMPSGTVPVGGSLRSVMLRESKAASNPVPDTPANRDRGRIYYDYYCRMCHGAKGNGDGPVGLGYEPKPSDLSSAAINAMSDGELYRRMLTGIGHEPVLEQTVPPEHRWPLVLHVRGLAAPGQRRPVPAPISPSSPRS